MLRMNFATSWEDKEGMNVSECWRPFCQAVSFCVMFSGHSFQAQTEAKGNNKACNE